MDSSSLKEIIIKKITPGYVIQTFNSEMPGFISQQFIATGDVRYEDMDGNKIPPGEKILQHYFPFNMEQPE